MSDVTNKLQNHGPHHGEGEFRIVTVTGRDAFSDGAETRLCHCGQSTNNPL